MVCMHMMFQTGRFVHLRCRNPWYRLRIQSQVRASTSRHALLHVHCICTMQSFRFRQWQRLSERNQDTLCHNFSLFATYQTTRATFLLCPWEVGNWGPVYWWISRGTIPNPLIHQGRYSHVALTGQGCPWNCMLVLYSQVLNLVDRSRGWSWFLLPCIVAVSYTHLTLPTTPYV